jgi:hypothetical protein
MFKCFSPRATAEEKKKAYEEFPEKAKKFLNALESMVPEKGFVLGKPTPTIADFALYDLVIAGLLASLSQMDFDMTPYRKINRIVD